MRARGIAFGCIIGVLALVFSRSIALAEKRVALVIGNSSYVNIPRLANPANDARLMAETLKSLGFTLIGNGAQIDLDKAGLDAAVQDFGRRLQGADVGLFYYAGHGVQVRGANYLVPVGANPTKESDVDFQMLDSNLVLRQMADAGTKLNLVILDACRNNPFGGRSLRAATGGLAQMQAPEGTLISFATQPGNVAQDGAGANSPYTRALADTLRRPGLDVFKTFNEVGLAVSGATGGVQQPWVSLSPIKGDFYFAGVATAPNEPAASRPAPDPCALAGEHWRSAEIMATRPALEDHLTRFPNCAFAGLAKARIATLDREAERQRQTAPAPEPKQAAPAVPDPPKTKFAALTATPVLLGQFQSWNAYAALPNGERLCFARNTKLYHTLVKPARKREPPYLSVILGAQANLRGGFSVNLGYKVTSRSAVSVDVDGASFTLWATDDGAWIESHADEPRLIEAMRRGSVITVKGNAADGAQITDTFTLKGFADAIDRGNQECR